MKIEVFSPRLIGSEAHDENYRAIQRILLALVNESPLAQAQALTDVELASGGNVVDHGLGREPQGVLAMPISAAATLYWDKSSTALLDRRVNVNASAACTATILLF